MIAEIVERHKIYDVARLMRVLTQSPYRREPSCPVVGRCGGCHWQHVVYSEQIRQKEMILKDNLRNLNRFSEVSFRPFLAATDEFRYRNRVQVHRRGHDIGFFAPDSHELVAIDDCWLADSQVTKAFATVRERANDPNARAHERIEIALRRDGRIEINPSSAEAVAGRFAQVNDHQNNVLIEVVREAVRGLKMTRVIDLYCGAGNLTFPLAEALPGSEVHGVDLSRVLISQAKELTKNHPAFRHMNWHAQTSSSFLESLSKKEDTLVVLDPPRPGCDRDTRTAIARLKPDRIIYVSCNPTTLARDAESWLTHGDYRVDFAQGIDMFPQTAHIEAVLSLSKNSASH